MVNKIIYPCITLLLALSFILSSCSNNANEELQEIDMNAEATLKVMYYDEKAFFENYGNYFTSQYPNVQLEVISTQSNFLLPKTKQEEHYYKLIEDHKPDVILIDESYMETMVDKELLYRLDSAIQRDAFDVDSILPFVIERIKGMGAGSIYGLATSFHTYAIYYNIDLFNQYKIDLPRDRMTWEELLELAARFPTTGQEDERVYGYAYTYLVSDPLPAMIVDIGKTKGLSYISSDAKQVTMDTEQWRDIIQNVVKTYQSGTIYTSREQGPNELFMKGRLAMRYESSSYRNRIASYTSKDKPLNWGIASTPVDPASPNQSLYSQLSDLFGVNSQSSNKSLAWAFVKFVNSEPLAKTLLNTTDGALPVRPAVISEANNKLDAFYTLTELQENSKRYKLLPPNFNIYPVLSRAVSGMIAGELTIDQAIQQLQEQGNEALDRAYKEESILMISE
ncbi:ABC transporter substrate-binding protein [Paenibacillus plantiphilus]|nr:extracellular solute-binding protein [Paenibacillus plantiphilus]